MIKIAIIGPKYQFEVTKARPHMPEGARPSLKQKVFGLNGARVYGVDVPERRRKTEADMIGTRKQAYRKMADPTFLSEFTKPA